MKISVLIIEDSKYAADLNVRQLRKAGFDVSYKVVSSRDEMEEAIHDQSWDIIISDNSMPGFSALQALEMRNKLGEGIPFVIVSEQVSPEEISQGMNNNCTAFVAKEKLIQLREVITDILCK